MSQPDAFPVSDYVSSHRMRATRIFVLLLFGAMLVTESSHEGKLFADVLFLAGLILIGIATTGRLWCALFISGHKRASVTTAGPYSITRNPLYFSSFIGFIGTGLCTETISFALAFALFFYPLYMFTINQEERYLGAKFGTEFADYCARTPRFFPNPRLYMEPETWVVSPGHFRRTMIDAVWFVWLIGVIELVEALHEHGMLGVWVYLP